MGYTVVMMDSYAEKQKNKKQKKMELKGALCKMLIYTAEQNTINQSKLSSVVYNPIKNN